MVKICYVLLNFLVFTTVTVLHTVDVVCGLSEDINRKQRPPLVGTLTEKSTQFLS